MPAPPNLSMDILRTLVAFHDLGSLACASSEIGRSQSAVSLQLRRLEEVVGTKLFRRNGRRLEPTEQGQIAVSYARSILRLNDELVRRLSGPDLKGHIRIGTQQDFTRDWLPESLSKFVSTHPAVTLTVKVESGLRVLAGIRSRQLDIGLTVGLGKVNDAQGETLGHLPLLWLARKGYSPPEDGPLPLILSGPYCWFRRAALAALDRSGRTWSIVFTSPNLEGLAAAARAGLGVTVQTPDAFQDGLNVLSTERAMPDIGEVDVTLHRSASAIETSTDTLFTLLRQHLLARLVTLTGFRPAIRLPRPDQPLVDPDHGGGEIG